MCEAVINIDGKKIYIDTLNLMKYYRASKQQRKILRIDIARENKWYKALRSRSIDYSIYSNDGFLSEMWACWAIYSRNYLRSIQSKKSLFGKSILDDFGEVKKIADLGCGFGYTTVSLKQIYPSAIVYGTNLEDTEQIKICRYLASRHGFNIVTDIGAIEPEIDLLFASEYFEHILSPIEHLIDIIEKLKPKNMLIANSFNVKSVGHFTHYKVNGQDISEKYISKIFNKTLIDHGYQKVKTKLWNNRPTYWKLVHSR